VWSSASSAGSCARRNYDRFELTTEPGPTLPDRPPRPLAVHFGVDAAVAFLAFVVVGLIVGLSIIVIAIVAVVVGAIAAPFTRRAEARALAARAAAHE
jgi:hypothetical protein